MANLGSLSIWHKLALIFIPLAGLLDLIGFGAPYWISHFRQHSGLWKYCNNYACGDFLNLPYLTGTLRTTQFFETIGLLAIGLSLILLILSICVSSLRGKKIVTILTAVSCLIAAGCIILGVIIYGSNVPTRILSWAFGLCIVGGLLIGLAGIFIIIALVSHKT